MLGDRIYFENDVVVITDIGEGDNALLCVTEYEDCCNAQITVAGEFYYPDGSIVGVRASGDSLYRNRGDQLIRLNRRNGATPPLGRYRCDIPDTTGTTRSFFIHIANSTGPTTTEAPVRTRPSIIPSINITGKWSVTVYKV